MKKRETGGLIYSTDPNLDTASDVQTGEADTLPPAKQDLRITLDKRLKGGKQATVIYNFVGRTQDLEALGKLLKAHCGVGGSVKEGEILLQGNVLAKVQERLKKEGYTFKLAGI